MAPGEVRVSVSKCRPPGHSLKREGPGDWSFRTWRAGYSVLAYRAAAGKQEVIRSIKRGKVWLLLNLPEDSYLKLILI